MPLTSHTTDSLPYIDPPPSPSSLAAATNLITSSSLPPHQPLHPSLPPLPPTSTTPLISTEMTRLSAHPDPAPFTSKDRPGVDMSRYSASSTSISTSSPGEEEEEEEEEAVRQAQINATYLRLRNEQLALLERYGRNAWVLGNEALEAVLRERERGLVEARAAVEEVNRGRKKGQVERGGEGVEDGVEGLERRWREGVGRGVEVGLAVREVEGRIRRGGG